LVIFTACSNQDSEPLRELLAEAKGLRGRTIFFRYALRNALLPQVTALGLSLGQIVSGGVLVEQVFAYPPVG
jgi:peptide/nickel transport system permease protein